MHGRLKVKTDSQKQLEKKLEREEKCRQFMSAQNKAFQMRSSGQMDSQSLAITAQLVSVNPDFYTIWNYRREILLSIKKEPKSDENEESFEKLCQNELQLTQNCLRVNPKSYCVWHQRYWIIQNMPNPDLKTEISLCNQLLLLDERNFHSWDYRKFVSKLAKVSVTEELEFSLQKIEQNFSNFSSWYYRSCLFTSSANNNELDFTKEWKREYDLVENAIFTDPSDQSSWFYHKWLVSTKYGQNTKHLPQMNSQTSVTINRIVLNLSQSQLIVGLSRPLKHNPLVMITVNDNFLTNIEWNSIQGLTSDVWFTDLKSFSAEELKSLAINPIPTFAINPECVQPLDIKVNEQNGSQLFVWERKPSDSDKQISLEDCYLKTLHELHKLEPNNKWVKLTLAWTDPNATKIDNIIDSLILLDPLRINYYKDLKSQTILKERIQSFQSMDSILLNNLNITALYDFNRLTHIRTLDLTDNNLVKLSKTFNYLLSLEVLIIDSNNIYSIDDYFKLNKLKVLSLNKNKISDTKTLTKLKDLINLETLLIRDNPISSALKDIKNSELLLSDELNIISIESDFTDFKDNKINGLKVYYNLF